MFKAKHLKEIQKFMEKTGIPGRGGWNLPTSKKSFPEGAHYRMEIAGVDRYSNLVVMVDDAKERSNHEIMERRTPDLKMAEQGPDDLRLPVVD